MLYRFTLTLDVAEDKQNGIDKLRNSVKSEAEWIGTNVNIKVEDESCIQANKKRLLTPIVSTLDTNTLPNDKNVYLSSAKLLLEYLKQLEETNNSYDDYKTALILGVNCLIEKGSKVESEKEERKREDECSEG